MAKCFAECGYDGATTAQIAKACEVRQNVLYRIWPDKEAMFVAVIEYIHDFSIDFWNKAPVADGETRAEAILRLQSHDHGILRYYRIVYSGLLQDSAEIRRAIRSLYRGIHTYIQGAVQEHRLQKGTVDCRFDAETAAWGMMGLGAMVDIQRELRIQSQAARKELLHETSRDGFLE